MVVVLLASMGGAAQADGEAEAEQLFRDAKKLMKQRHYEEACTAFETSNRLAPAITTLINLADCREMNGQLATAWTLFLEVRRQVRDDEAYAALGETAEKRGAKLEPRLSYMTVTVPAESDIAGLTVTRNGMAFDAGLWNRALPVDGGTYIISGTAPGHEPWSDTVTVPGEGGAIAITVPTLETVEPHEANSPSEGATPTPEPPDGRRDPPSTVAAERPHRSSFTGRRKIALGVGAVGLLGVGGGVLFGLQADGLNQDAVDRCPSPTGCDDPDEANQLVARAYRRAELANISYGIAGVALVVTAVLWFTGTPRLDAAAALTPTVDTHGASLSLTGSF